MADYRKLSFWFDSLPVVDSGHAGADDLRPRPALAGAIDVDVAIVGGGLTGLWTAYYIARETNRGIRSLRTQWRMVLRPVPRIDGIPRPSTRSSRGHSDAPGDDRHR